MKLICYVLDEFASKMVPARPQRQWMDQFPDRHVYRCLPMTIANSHGRELLCPAPIEIIWIGGPRAPIGRNPAANIRTFASWAHELE